MERYLCSVISMSRKRVFTCAFLLLSSVTSVFVVLAVNRVAGMAHEVLRGLHEHENRGANIDAAALTQNWGGG